MNEPLLWGHAMDAQCYLMQVDRVRGWSEPGTRTVTCIRERAQTQPPCPSLKLSVVPMETAAARRGAGPWFGKSSVSTNVICMCKRLFLPSLKKKLRYTCCWCSIPVLSPLVLTGPCKWPWEKQELQSSTRVCSSHRERFSSERMESVTRGRLSPGSELKCTWYEISNRGVLHNKPQHNLGWTMAQDLLRNTGKNVYMYWDNSQR